MYDRYFILKTILQIVDACLTDDGDAFLYGAKEIYRNFTMDSKVSQEYAFLFLIDDPKNIKGLIYPNKISKEIAHKEKGIDRNSLKHLS